MFLYPHSLRHCITWLSDALGNALLRRRAPFSEDKAVVDAGL